MSSVRRLAPGIAAMIVAAAAASSCKPSGDVERRTSSSSAEGRARRERPKVPLTVPSEDTIPAGPAGDLVRRGRFLATHTSEELPDLVGADLHCTSCHLEAATRANAGPWVGVSAVLPEYRARAGREVTLSDRIEECFERSMNGKAPGQDSPVTKALVAYIDWLSRDVPPGSEVVGRGFARLERPPIVDDDSGRNGYLARCAPCHGVEGGGARAADGSYLFPPLWGERSFNIGAGMARLDTAAAFIRHNMPLGQPDSLTALDAYEIAAYVIQQPRADYEKKRLDWPAGGKPSDARY